MAVVLLGKPVIKQSKLCAIAATLPPLSEAPPPAPAPEGLTWPYSSAHTRGDYVRKGPEWERINALPRVDRAEVRARIADIVAEESARYRVPGSKATLYPEQALALREARTGPPGQVGFVGVGNGKTLLTLLLPRALGRTDRVVVMVPPALLAQARADFAGYARDWAVVKPDWLSYGKLAHHSGTAELSRLAPTLIVADEAHALRNPDSARVRRFIRYFAEHPDTSLCVLSGTLAVGSIRDYATLSALALREYSPLPTSGAELGPWANALDPWTDPNRVWAPGALLEWTNGPATHPEAWRAGYHSRVSSAPGVVASPVSGNCEATLNLAPWDAKLVPELNRVLCQVRESGTLPSGEELAEPLTTARGLKQLALGFYYRWVWSGPGGLPSDDESAWLLARNGWNRAVRQFLEASAAEGLDSPFLVEQAVKGGRLTDSGLCEALAVREAWAHVPEPPIETVWISDSLVNSAVEWALASRTRSIVWYQSRAVAERIGARLRHIVPGAAIPASEGARTEPLLLSIASHGVGKNLQFASRALVLEPPSGGARWEQLLARLHRPGQRAESVDWEVATHTPELRAVMAAAFRESEYLQATTGQRQKLSMCRKSLFGA